MLKTCNLKPFIADTNKQLNDLLSHVQGRRVTPPFWYAVFRFSRRYAVRKGSVRNTQISCYIVRRHIFLLKNVQFTSRNTINVNTRSNNSNFSRARFACAFWGQKLALNFTIGVPKFGRFWRFSSIISIIYEHICIQFGIKQVNLSSIRVMLDIRIIEL